jgi:hypothetical protein
LADYDFNLAALHPAYPIKRRTSAERTQASPERRHPEEPLALDPLENNIRRFEPSLKPLSRPFGLGSIAELGIEAKVLALAPQLSRSVGGAPLG